MSKSWFVRADYTVYADTLDEAMSKWMWSVNMATREGSEDVVFDGVQEIYENEWENLQ